MSFKNKDIKDIKNIIEEDEVCDNCGYKIEECSCNDEDDWENTEDELFKENPLKAIWIKSKEKYERLERIEERLQALEGLLEGDYE